MTISEIHADLKMIMKELDVNFQTAVALVQCWEMDYFQSRNLLD